MKLLQRLVLCAAISAGLAWLCGGVLQASADPAAEAVRNAANSLAPKLSANLYGGDWRRDLRWDELLAELNAPQPNRQTIVQLANLYARLGSSTDRPEFLALRDALENWADALANVPPEKLPALARAARETFRRPSADQLRQQRDSLRKATDTLDRYLGTQGANGKAWKKYLLWDELSRQLRSTQPAATALAEVDARFSSGQPGLELPVVADVRRALAVLLPTVRLIEEPGARGEFAGLLSELASLLEAPPHESAGYEMPLAKRRQRIGQILGWLEQRGLTPDLIAAVRRHDSHPNLLVRLSRPLLAAEVDGPFDQTGPVRQVILGSTYSGMARTIGMTGLTLIPDARRAVVEISFAGRSNANTSSYVGQGRFARSPIYSRTVTDFQAHKQLELDGDGIHLQPSVAQARVTANSTSISVKGLGSQAVRRRVAESRPQAESQSARYSERELRRQLDEEVAKLLHGLDSNLPPIGGKPASWRQPYAPALRFSTTATQLAIVGMQADPFQLGAPAGLLDAAPEADLAVQLHESWLNNRSQDLLAGKTLTDDTLETALSQVMGWLPEHFDSSHREQAGQPRWSIALARQSPLAVHLADGICEIVVCVDRFIAGADVYPAMNITARYKIETVDGKAKLVLKDKLGIYPPGFVPGSGKRLGGRYQTYRRALEKRFSSIFPTEIPLDGLRLDESSVKSAPLSNAGLSIRDGWLTLAFKRAS